MKQMVVLSSVPWYPQPTRIQQILSRLPHYRILYCEPPPIGKPPTKGKGASEPGDTALRVGDFITLMPMPPISPHAAVSKGAARRAGKKLGKAVARAMRENGIDDNAIVWCCAPGAADILPHFPHGSVIYDAGCHEALSGGTESPAFLKDLEEELILSADLILAPSEDSRITLAQSGRPVRLLPGGAHFTLFHSVCEEDLPFPDELFAVQNPIIGYVGGIDAGTDLTYIEAAARMHPEWSFVLVGMVSDDAELEPVEKLSNVHMLGFRPHKLLPRYIARFDVCVSLSRYKEGSASPLKLYEYLATGKPIVSTPHPRQVMDYMDVVYIAGTHNEFSECCRKAITEHDAWRTRQRIAYGKAASWDARVAELERIMAEQGIL